MNGLKVKYIHNTFTVPCERSKIVSFASSIMKKIAAFFTMLSVKLICYIVFASPSSPCWLPKSVVIIL